MILTFFYCFSSLRTIFFIFFRIFYFFFCFLTFLSLVCCETFFFAIVSVKKMLIAVSRLRTNNLKEKVFFRLFSSLMFFISYFYEIEIFGTIYSDYHTRTQREAITKSLYRERAKKLVTSHFMTLIGSKSSSRCSHIPARLLFLLAIILECFKHKHIIQAFISLLWSFSLVTTCT